MRVLLGGLMVSLAFGSALPAQTLSPPTEAAVPNVDQRGLAMDLAKRLESDFVYAEQGKRYASALRRNAGRGDYDGLKGAELALKLSDDLQSVAPDGHLRVMFEGVGGGPRLIIKRPPDAAGGPPPGDRKPVMMRVSLPPAIEHAGWIAPGIAFVRFNGFPSEPETVAAVRKFMIDHADAKAVIFDLRTHMGGGLGEMDEIFPWLFSKPTHLVTMATRRSVDEAGGSPVAGVPTLRTVPGDPDYVTREHWVTPGASRQLDKAKVFVLTSGFSASAAEHFVLALKQTGRATVIGRKTAGANHFGGDQDLGGGYSVFLPVGRAFDPTTGKDWEGVGVAPDIDVAPEKALVMALTQCGLEPEKAEQLSAQVAPSLPMIG
jgi:hypothetical protein